MLKKIIGGAEKSRFVLIVDNFKHKKNKLLQCIIKSYCTRFDQTHLVCYSRITSKLAESVPHSSEKLTIHDGYTDPMRWEGATKDHMIHHDTDMYQYLSTKYNKENQAVIIDDMNMLLARYSVTHVYNMIHCLLNGTISGSPVFNIVAVVHNELLDETMLNTLRHQASSVILLAGAEEGRATCDVTHRRHSGKVIREIVTYTVTDSYEVQEKSEAKQNKVATPQDSTVDPLSGLTFSLGLSDKEKEDRKNLVLPYMRMQHITVSHEPPGTVQQVAPGGAGEGPQIFYQPTREDDIDEEDPDDDLDI